MNLHQIIISPITTEKSTRLQEDNQHSFKVHPKATKIDVLNAIRMFYGVTPVSVRVMRCPAKTRMIGRSKTFTKRRAYKKAIVRLPAGESIELVSVKKSDAKVKVKKADEKKPKKEVAKKEEKKEIKKKEEKK